MSNFVTRLPDITISESGTDSALIAAKDYYADASTITFFAPATLPETISIQISYTDVASEAVWYELDSSSLEAGGLLTIGDLSFKAFRIHSSSAVAADRTFKLNKQDLVY